MKRDDLTAGILVEAVKFTAWLHQWTPDQVNDPEKGVKDHLERIQACNGVWQTTRMLMVIDDRLQMLQPVMEKYESWTSGLTDMYTYLSQSPEPFPGSFVTMGMRLTPSKKDLDNDTTEYLKKLQVRVETLLLKSSMHEQQAEIQTVRRKLLFLREAHVNSAKEKEIVQAEITRMEDNLRVARDRDEFQDRYMSCLQEYLDFVREATAAAESLVSEDETKA